jgi:hypothetical protein
MTQHGRHGLCIHIHTQRHALADKGSACWGKGCVPVSSGRVMRVEGRRRVEGPALEALRDPRLAPPYTPRGDTRAAGQWRRLSMCRLRPAPPNLHTQHNTHNGNRTQYASPSSLPACGCGCGAHLCRKCVGCSPSTGPLYSSACASSSSPPLSRSSITLPAPT